MATSNGPAGSEDTNIVAVIHPSPRLCPRCTFFPWPSRPDDNGPLFQFLPFHETFNSLQESADQGCALCRFAWLSIVSDWTMATEVVKSLTNGLKGSIVLDVFICGTVLTLSPMIKHEGKRLFGRAVTAFQLSESNEMELLGEIRTRHIKAFNGQNIQEELAELVKHEIQPWMESCRERHVYHESCGTTNDISGLPTRLVDVGEMNDLLVKLVEVKSCTNFQDFTYLILSYCWGDGNENSKTTEGNLDTRLRGFAVSDLPKTIRDAILLTRMMGFRYLWVDAMCIIQGPSGDFHSESPRMGDYYSNAACCISASAAKDSKQGFLTERPLARFPIDDIAIRIARHDTTGRVYSNFEAVENSSRPIKTLLMSPLAKRGWCLQETALPKRILHWTFQGLYLECQSSLFLENAKVPCKYRSLSETLTPRVMMAMPDEDILFSDGWYQLVSNFSKTQLTYETDRLYAIHGLVSILIQRLEAEYFNGLFRSSLAQGLLWYHPNSNYGAYNRPKNAQLPSWCWVSSCPVDYMRICKTPVFVRDDHAERSPRFPTNSESISTVESTTSRLYIRAPIIQLEIGRNTVGYMRKGDSGHKESFRCLYNLDMNREVLLGMPDTPHLDAERGQGAIVLWLPVGRPENAYSSAVGLLVHELTQEGKGVYCRYGVLHHLRMDDEDRLRDVKDVILI